ncbi:MAG TPA: hypothetical protein VHK90_17285 [Thermoanaerobaculia bacterium]|nr:hypothetical protein [Thermoanaerobaculia bacterium]
MRTAALALTALLLASCGSTDGGLGSLGDIILGSPSTSQSSDVRGVVTYVDERNQSIDLDVSYINNLRDSNNGQRGTIYFDNRTRVVFGGREYAVADLERGDEIAVRGFNNNGRYVAETIEVLRDVSR